MSLVLSGSINSAPQRNYHEMGLFIQVIVFDLECRIEAERESVGRLGFSRDLSGIASTRISLPGPKWAPCSIGYLGKL